MIQSDESEKLKNHYGKQNSEEITLKEKIKIILNPKCIYNFSPHLLKGQPFRFDKCCVYGRIVKNLMDIKINNCGHFYLINCFNRFIQAKHDLNEKN